jgi:hypothetical protein
MSGQFLGIIILLISSIYFAYSFKIPIAFLFSSVISVASSLFMFSLSGGGVGGGGGTPPSFAFALGTIFIGIALWQITEFIRNVIE